MKWPEKWNPKDFQAESVKGECIGRNNAIDACRAVLEEACGREELESIIIRIITSVEGNTKWENRCNPKFIADAIRRHLGLEGK